MIKYKILSGADSPILGFLKEQARKMIAQLGGSDQFFHKQFTIGEEIARIRGHLVDADWVVKIEVAGGFQDFVVGGLLPNLCSCRNVYISESLSLPSFTTFQTFSSYTPSPHANDPLYSGRLYSVYESSGYHEISVAGVVVGTIPWSYKLEKQAGEEIGPMGVMQVYDIETHVSHLSNYAGWPQYLGAPAGFAIYLLTGVSRGYYGGGHVGEPTVTALDLSVYVPSGSANTRVLAATSPYAVAEELASEELLIDAFNNKGNYDPYKTWSGGGYIDLYTDDDYGVGAINSTFTFSKKLTFEPPSDACYYDPVPYPGTNPTLEADWEAAREDALVNARAYAKSCSDNAMGLLDAAIISPRYNLLLKGSHPLSEGTYVDQYISARSVWTPLITTVLETDGPTNVRTREARTATTTLSYTDAEGNLQSEVFAGTYERLIQMHKDADNLYTGESHTYTYDKWFFFNTNNVDVQLTSLYLYAADSPSVFSSVQDLGYITGSRIDVISGDINQPYTPSIPYEANLPAATYPLIYTTWRSAFAPKYSIAPPSALVDVRLSDGETVLIVPFFYVHLDHGELGHLPLGLDGGPGDDYDEADQMYIDRVYEAEWSYVNGFFTLTGKRVLPEPVYFTPVRSRTIDFPPPIGTVTIPVNINSLFIFSGAKYADVKATFAAQAARLQSPPADEPLDALEQLYKDVKQAIKSAT